MSLARLMLVPALAVIALGCGQDSAKLPDLPSDGPTGLMIESAPSPSPEMIATEEPNYPGISIDEVFPITGSVSTIDDGGREPGALFETSGYQVRVVDYVPRTLERNGEILFRFEQRAPDGYWATGVGSSKLLGAGSSEVYVGYSGPGGVCCTNYSVIDVSSGRPRSIFHSEDFGGFRDEMEIFDADGDGVYELMQYDSCFRYFIDDCGSCSPQPRAYLKFDKSLKQYLPAKGIVQDFVKEGHNHSDEWLSKKYAEFQQTKDVGLSLDIRRSALAHMVDLLFIGEEQRAWRVYEKYIDDPKGETRREVRRRLATCKFYQALKRR